ncbi:MAG: SCO6745 family protein [Actinomycetota bacterium]
MAFRGTVSDERVSEVSRRLRSRCDGIVAAVWFMPEAPTGFTELGLSAEASSLGSRVAPLGRVPGRVASAVVAPMCPGRAVPAIDEAWRVTDPETLLAARLRCATAYLADVIGAEPEGVGRAVALLQPVVEAGPTEGHLLYAGLRSLPWPGTALGDLWRACDMVRERRGGSHLNAWVAAGLDPVELLLLTEQWRTTPNPGSAGPAAMGWPEPDAGAGRARLRDRGLLDEHDAITDAGRAVRDEVELATDRQERVLVAALGDDVDELFELLAPWARAVVARAA